MYIFWQPDFSINFFSTRRKKERSKRSSKISHLVLISPLEKDSKFSLEFYRGSLNRKSSYLKSLIRISPHHSIESRDKIFPFRLLRPGIGVPERRDRSLGVWPWLLHDLFIVVLMPQKRKPNVSV